MLKDNSLNSIIRYKDYDGIWHERTLYEFITKQSIVPVAFDPETFCFCLVINNMGYKVFEKDIIKVDDSNWGYGGEYDIKHDGYLYYIVPTIKYFTYSELEYPFTYLKSDNNITIIGNIFDNPELLSKITSNYYQMEDEY